MPVVTKWQSDLLAFAVGRAQGINGKLFESRTKFQQTLARACKRAGIPHTTPNDLRRTYSTWLRACGVPNELSAPTMVAASARASLARERKSSPKSIPSADAAAAIFASDGIDAPVPDG